LRGQVLWGLPGFAAVQGRVLGAGLVAVQTQCASLRPFVAEIIGAGRSWTAWTSGTPSRDISTA
jgi:hypothetical protein